MTRVERLEAVRQNAQEAGHDLGDWKPYRPLGLCALYARCAGCGNTIVVTDLAIFGRPAECVCERERQG